MNKYQFSNVSESANSLSAMMFASDFLWPMFGYVAPEHEKITHSSYEINGVNSSFSEDGGVSPYYDQTPLDLDEQIIYSLRDVYTDLLDRQENLGQEFSKVLHENLWDLYVA